jgi:DNA repair protein RadC
MCQEQEALFWEDLKSGKFASMVRESVKAQSLSNASEVYNIVKPLFAEQDDVEAFYGIFLNAANRVLCIDKLCSGTLSSTAIYPREIVKKVLTYKSTAIVFAHNHPSGKTDPSREDYAITTKLAIALSSHRQRRNGKCGPQSCESSSQRGFHILAGGHR